MATHRNTDALKTGLIPDDVSEALTLFRDPLAGWVDSVMWHSQVGSTNDLAMTLAEQGGAEGTVVGADMQTAGRGRQGRTWASPPGAGLYVSIVLRPPARVASLLTIAAGVALVEGIRDATGLCADLKWPNDVYVSGRKLAGILAEAGTSSGHVSFVVLGFGINLMPAAYPPEVASRATSLEFELGRPVDRGLVLASCLVAMAQRYRQLTSSQTGTIVDAWRAHAAPLFGRAVECTHGSERVTGTAEDIDSEGALLVRTSGGLIRIISGEVVWR